MSLWNQISLEEFEAVRQPGRHIWVSDGYLGFARAMRPGETTKEAIADFDTAGEPAEDYNVYENGEVVATAPMNWRKDHV